METKDTNDKSSIPPSHRQFQQAWEDIGPTACKAHLDAISSTLTSYNGIFDVQRIADAVHHSFFMCMVILLKDHLTMRDQWNAEIRMEMRVLEEILLKQPHMDATITRPEMTLIDTQCFMHDLQPRLQSWVDDALTPNASFLESFRMDKEALCFTGLAAMALRDAVWAWEAAPSPKTLQATTLLFLIYQLGKPFDAFLCKYGPHIRYCLMLNLVGRIDAWELDTNRMAPSPENLRSLSPLPPSPPDDFTHIQDYFETTPSPPKSQGRQAFQKKPRPVLDAKTLPTLPTFRTPKTSLEDLENLVFYFVY